MSAPMVEAVFLSDLKPAGARCVALALAWCAHDRHQDHIRVGLGRIAAMAGVGRDYAKTVVRDLLTTGVIELVKRSPGGAHVAVNTYRFKPAWVEAQRCVDDASRGVCEHPGPAAPGSHSTREPQNPGAVVRKPGVSRPPSKGNPKGVSVNAPAVPLDRDRPAGGPVPTAMTTRSDTGDGKQTTANSQTRPGGERRPGSNGAQRKPPVVPWLSSHEATSARGVEMGLGPLGDRSGKEYFAYVRDLMAADKAAGAPWARQVG